MRLSVIKSKINSLITAVEIVLKKEKRFGRKNNDAVISIIMIVNYVFLRANQRK